MSDSLDIPASNSPPESLSDSEPETDNAGGFESDGESNREKHVRQRLSSRYTAESC